MLPCSHCGELLPDATTVCPHCGAFDPFSGTSPGVVADQDPRPAQEAREGWLKGLLKEIGCQCSVGCGSLLAVGVIAAIVAVIAAFCGGSEGEFGYDPETREINCQEYVDVVVEESKGQLWGDDEVEVFSIRANMETDRVDWDKEVCPGVAETSKGRYEIWSFVVGEDDHEWTFGYEMKPLSSPVSEPRPMP